MRYVFDFFEDFLAIPRESSNEKEIADYLVNFSIKYKLEYYRDEYNNVIIKKNNHSQNTIILQGHIDMVCVSNTNYNFKDNGISWYIEDGYYKAKNTSLGADNGIGCSIILYILTLQNMKLPNIEAVFTSEEETSMNGAKRLDYSKIIGKDLISVDGTGEGVIEVSSAGMVCMKIKYNTQKIINNFCTYELEVDDFSGGHSGIDIAKNILNPIKYIFSFLKTLDAVYINCFDGGSAYNTIPSSFRCIISTPDTIDLQNYRYIKIKRIRKRKYAFSLNTSNELINYVNNLKIGVLSYKNSYPQTSMNLSKISTLHNKVIIDLSLRSSNKNEESAYINKLLHNNRNFRLDIKNTIPFFEYNEHSNIRDILISSYKQLYHKNIKIEHVHAGLEGGIFSNNISGLDINVIAPNIFNIHTINEKVEIASVNRVTEWLIKSLEKVASK